MLKSIFNIPFFIWNDFAPSIPLLLLLLQHHLVRAAALKSLPLDRKTCSVGVSTKASIFSSSLDSLWSWVKLIACSLVELLFIIVTVVVFEHALFGVHGERTNNINRTIRMLTKYTYATGPIFLYPIPSPSLSSSMALATCFILLCRFNSCWRAFMWSTPSLVFLINSFASMPNA